MSETIKTISKKLPQEILDKVFLYLDWNTLSNTRKIQSDYVKKITEFEHAEIAAFDRNISNMKWLIYNRDITDVSLRYAFKYVMYNDDIETVKWFLDSRYKPYKQNKYIIDLAERFGNPEMIALVKKSF